MRGGEMVRAIQGLWCLGLGGALTGLLTACLSPRVSALKPPQALQAVYTPGFESRSARLDYDEKGLFWANGWVRMRKDQKFKAGDIIRTRDDRSLTVLLPSTYSRIWLLPGSILAIEQLERASVTNGPSIARFYLQEGRLQLRSHLVRSNSVEEVRTPFGIASSIPLELSKPDRTMGVHLPEALRLSDYEISAEGDVTAIGPILYTDLDGTTNLTHGAIKQLPLTAELPARMCQVHRLPMKRKPGQIVYGLLSPDSISHLREKPNNGFAFAGCVRYANSPSTKTVWVCDRCSGAAVKEVNE